MPYEITSNLSDLSGENQLKISRETTQTIAAHRATIQRILSGEDTRKLIICGPCSIHARSSALSYARRLAALAQTVSDELFLVMRVYFEKPRTQYAWKGFLHQPSVTGPLDLARGITDARAILAEIAELGVPAGTEILSPSLVSYVEDLVSWGCIGARTSESQTHRELASSFTAPVGFKNTTTGNVEIAINGMISASYPHQLMRAVDGVPHAILSEGNSYAHLVLRGRNYPSIGSNYDEESVRDAIAQLERSDANAGVLIDCSHGNCDGDYRRQADVARVALEHVKRGLAVRGVLIESHLRGGNTPAQGEIPDDISITDPCLSWEDTEAVILEWAEALRAL